MTVIKEHINRISSKLQLLVKDYQLLKKDNQRQTALIKELEAEKLAYKDELATLRQQVSILKSATGQLAEADKKNFEKQINQYIRELDKCISYLSN
ncbi:MAG: hypothetical protein WCJ85_08695 [Chitinophagaceae bacterium]